jgi:plasmid maintenance system antidote protein VapI
MDVSALIDSVDMPLAELARRMGVSDGHVFDLKSGRRRLTVKMAALERPGIVDDVLAAMRREAA